MHLLRLTKPDGRALILHAIRSQTRSTRRARTPRRSTPTPTSAGTPCAVEVGRVHSHRQNRTFLPPPRVQPTRAVQRSAEPDRSTRRALGRRGVRESLPHADAARARSAAHDCGHAAWNGRVRGRSVHAGRTGVARRVAATHTWSSSSTCGRSVEELGARDDVEYVFPFENRGVEVGVTLHHPHGQIYAYPFVPPIAARELAQQRAYFEAHGRGLLANHLRAEERHGPQRFVYTGTEVVALVPVCARYPYEVWIAPRRGAASLANLQRAGSAPTSHGPSRRCCSSTTGSGRSRSPTSWSFTRRPPTAPRIPRRTSTSFYPAYRMPNRLKFLAGSETGAGVFTADTLPDEKAAELRAVEVTLE